MPDPSADSAGDTERKEPWWLAAWVVPLAMTAASSFTLIKPSWWVPGYFAACTVAAYGYAIWRCRP